MKRIVFSQLTLAALIFCALPAQAALLGVTGSGAIITAPADVSDDAATNMMLEGFDEQQNVLLTSDLLVDGGSVMAGATIDSHMIFLNSEGVTSLSSSAIFEFTGNILGVMSDRGGRLEALSNSFLGAAGTVYPGAFNSRGLESTDSYSIISPNMLSIRFQVSEPGDWIRVVTTSEVPEPASLTLMGLAGLGLLSRRRRRA